MFQLKIALVLSHVSLIYLLHIKGKLRHIGNQLPGKIFW